MKKFHTKRAIFTAVIIGIAFFAGIMIGNVRSNNLLFGQEVSSDENYFRYYKMFRETYKILQDEFVNSNQVDSKTLLSGAIKGLLESTGDPYTDYLPPDIAKEFSDNINGSFFGVGIRIEMRNNWLTIIAPIQGTPAARANLQPGDQIAAIDGKTTEGITSLEAISRIRGKLGTTVTLTIARPGALTPFDVDLKRAKIEIDTVESDIINYEGKQFAYIKLIEFSTPTEKEILQAFKKIITDQTDGIILDVRNNPGGLLSSVAAISDMFIEKGLIVYTRGRLENENYEFTASKGKTVIDSKIPVVILGNQGSASASEILIGALKDTGRAAVVGKKTFGKGSVQKTRPLSDGSLIKYTIAKYYSPSGQVIDKLGIEPDVEVDLWYDKLSDAEKTSLFQLQITNIISEFIYDNKTPSAEDITALHDDVTKQGYNVSLGTLQNAIRQRQNFTSTNVYDLVIDDQLKEALKISLTNTVGDLKYDYVPKGLDELHLAELEAAEKLKSLSNTN